MYYKIILTKINKKPVVALVQKHKIKDIIAVIKLDNIIIDFIKLHKYVKNGCSFSRTAFDIIYKKLAKNQNVI